MKTIEIRCKNNKKILNCEIGSTLSDIFLQIKQEIALIPVAAKVNNEIVGLNYELYSNKTIEFIDTTTSAGMRIYTRTLFLVLCKAVKDVFPDGSIKIEFPVSNGYYCDLRIGRYITPDDVTALRNKMNEIIAAKKPIVYHQKPTEEVVEMFRNMNDTAKVMLLESLGRIYTTYCSIDDYVDYFYGPTLTNTGDLNIFGLEMYNTGLLLRTPRHDSPNELGKFIRQDKMFDVFTEYHKLQDRMHISTVGALNLAIQTGHSKELIYLFEALQEKQLIRIADKIAECKGIKVVLIAGPSSSGKTTTCKRLSVQLAANGIYPVGISLDDYFVNREETPRDEKGEYDYESLYSLNLPLFNEQLNALIAGEEVELPRYNFITGQSEMSGNKLQLKENEVLIIEGIHALNPELTSQIQQDQIFRVYASALTSITLDDHNYIPTTDNRLLRRIIRDFKYRNNTAQQTIKRWASVRAGEEKWIFPYQENADAMFNTAMLFELAVIKSQAEPLLEQVPQNCDEYAEAKRLLQFLRYIKPLQESLIPPMSLLREFLGGSSFDY
ncbi:MAG: nucleoside kinase [Prevotella sp.]|nr:nucleoside kinase [Candidatus Prevotella equi]